MKSKIIEMKFKGWRVRLTIMQPYFFGWYKEDIANPESGKVIFPKGKFWWTRYWVYHYHSAKNVRAYTIRILGFNFYIAEPGVTEKLIKLINEDMVLKNNK